MPEFNKASAWDADAGSDDSQGHTQAASQSASYATKTPAFKEDDSIFRRMGNLGKIPDLVCTEALSPPAPVAVPSGTSSVIL